MRSLPDATPLSLPATWSRIRGIARLMAAIILMLAQAAVQGQQNPAQPTPEEGAAVIYISDMTKCLPGSALSDDVEKGKWQLIRYETGEVSGTMIGAASFIDAPDMTLRLGVSGWHEVYIGYWNPFYAYDGGVVVKARLSGAEAFRRFREGSGCRSQTETCLREVLVDRADLTGQDIVFGKSSGPLGQKCYVAYVKLVPMSTDQVAAVNADRAQRDTRRLTATIDGLSYFHHGECTTPEHVMELIEPYRHSDVGTVLWAASYGDLTNYPSQVGTFIGSDACRSSLVEGPGTNSYIIGEKAMWSNLRHFAEADRMPQAIAADHAHSMGLKFDLMFRLGIGGHLPPSRHPGEAGYVARHPQFRQVLRNGKAVEKASYAFPEVRQFVASMIREAAEKFDVDGINLCFVRGPHFISYEQPVLDEFEREYGVAATEVAPDDPRLGAVRSRHMTQFIRGARKVLDEAGARKGRRLTLSIWAWPGKQGVWCGGTPMQEGLDVSSWIRDGLLDSVICQEGIDEEYVALGKEHGCKFVLFTGYGGDKAMSPGTIAGAFEAGVEQFAYWDIDAAQDYPHVWEWLSRAGHRDEMKQWESLPRTSRWLRLETINGYDVHEGLQQAAYSVG